MSREHLARRSSPSATAARVAAIMFSLFIVRTSPAQDQDPLKDCTALKLTPIECARKHEKEFDAIQEDYSRQHLGVIERDGLRDGPVKGPFDTWQDYFDGKLTTVWAGYYFPDPRDGTLFVGLGESDVNGKEYPSPVKAGPLRIISVIDGIVQLRTRAGTFAVYSGDGEAHPSVRIDHVTYFTFDLRTLKYVKR